MKIWKCKQCGKCCSYVILPLPRGTSADTVAWYNAHQHISVQNGYIIIKSKCKNLGYKNGKHYCKIYENRPKICRDAGEKECLK